MVVTVVSVYYYIDIRFIKDKIIEHSEKNVFCYNSILYFIGLLKIFWPAILLAYISKS